MMIEPISDNDLLRLQLDADHNLLRTLGSMDVNTIRAILARLEAAEAERDAARDALSAWFDTEKRTMDEMRPQLRAAFYMYLHKVNLIVFPVECLSTYSRCRDNPKKVQIEILSEVYSEYVGATIVLV